MKKLLILSIILLAAGRAAPVWTEEETPVKAPLPLDIQFYAGLSRAPAILRDDYLKKRLNSIVLGRGVITSIIKTPGFKKNHRIDIIEREAERLGIRIIYRIHVDSGHTIAMMKENERLEFTGQLIGYTPTNSRRDAYILDILLEKGAMLIE